MAADRQSMSMRESKREQWLVTYAYAGEEDKSLQVRREALE
jgi:hypothetical protein